MIIIEFKVINPSTLSGNLTVERFIGESIILPVTGQKLHDITKDEEAGYNEKVDLVDATQNHVLISEISKKWS